MNKKLEAKAIETIYNGYKFRSRLEARWAVFYDTLGVVYEYEKEGFDLGEAGWYLPDFWLPEMDCWIEIKGSRPNKDEKAKAQALATATEKIVFVFHGEVWPITTGYIGPKIEGGCRDFIISNGGFYFTPMGDSDGVMEWGFCEKCGKYTIGHLGSHAIDYGEWDNNNLKCCWYAWEELTLQSAYGNGNPLFDSDILESAYKKARQARFEHGEEGPQLAF